MFNPIKEVIFNVASKGTWLPLLLTRLIIGAVFIPTGWGKLHSLGQVTEYFKSLGIPAPALQAPFVASVELAGGLLVLLGLFTRLASVPLMGTMVVALLTAKLSGFSGPLDIFAAQEFDYLVLLTVLFVFGAGAVSADRMIPGMEKK